MSFDRYEFFKECYYKELEYKHNIIVTLNAPYGYIALIGGFAGYIFINYEFSVITIAYFDELFTIMFILLFIAISVSLVYLFKASNGQIYAYIQNVDKINKYYDELCNYYSEGRAKDSGNLALKNVSSFLEKAYIEAATNNFLSNKNKSLYRHLSHISIFISFTLFIVVFVLYLISKLPDNYGSYIVNSLPDGAGLFILLIAIGVFSWFYLFFFREYKREDKDKVGIN